MVYQTQTHDRGLFRDYRSVRIVALGVDFFPVPGNSQARLRGRVSLAPPDCNPLGGHRV